MSSVPRYPVAEGEAKVVLGAGAPEILVGGISFTAPELALWRAPTDNDGIAQGWMAGVGVRGRWLGWGLDSLRVVEREMHERRGSIVNTTTWQGADDVEPIVHRQVISIVDHGVRFDETVTIPRSLDDLPRVGMRMVMPRDFSTFEWHGPGPHESYPDRVSEIVGRWTKDVDGDFVHYPVPQENGHHHDVRWFALHSRRRRRGLLIAGDRRLGFNASRAWVDSLSAASHDDDLVWASDVEVHVDIAHRGLGTAACGPDTHPRHRISGGRFHWTWTVTPTTGW